MSAGMAEVIAAHSGFKSWTDGSEVFTACAADDCDWELEDGASIAEHYAHVAEELAKAGYGNVQQAWDEGRKHGATWPYGKKGLAVYENPYRKTA